jgi:hypothetical protein
MTRGIAMADSCGSERLFHRRESDEDDKRKEQRRPQDSLDLSASFTFRRDQRGHSRGD